MLCVCVCVCVCVCEKKGLLKMEQVNVVMVKVNKHWPCTTEDVCVQVN